MLRRDADPLQRPTELSRAVAREPRAIDEIIAELRQVIPELRPTTGLPGTQDHPLSRLESAHQDAETVAADVKGMAKAANPNPIW